MERGADTSRPIRVSVVSDVPVRPPMLRQMMSRPSVVADTKASVFSVDMIVASIPA